MSDNKGSNALTAIFAFIALVVLFATLKGCDACTDKGGVYVRGAIWYSCVQPAEVDR